MQDFEPIDDPKPVKLLRLSPHGVYDLYLSEDDAKLGDRIYFIWDRYNKRQMGFTGEELISLCNHFTNVESKRSK